MSLDNLNKMTNCVYEYMHVQVHTYVHNFTILVDHNGVILCLAK